MKDEQFNALIFVLLLLIVAIVLYNVSKDSRNASASIKPNPVYPPILIVQTFNNQTTNIDEVKGNGNVFGDKNTVKNQKPNVEYQYS